MTAACRALMINKIRSQQQGPHFPLETANIMQSRTSDIVSQLVQKCWSAEPKVRPTIQAIINSFKYSQVEPVSIWDANSWHANSLQASSSVAIKVVQRSQASQATMPNTLIESENATRTAICEEQRIIGSNAQLR